MPEDIFIKDTAEPVAEKKKTQKKTYRETTC